MAYTNRKRKCLPPETPYSLLDIQQGTIRGLDLGHYSFLANGKAIVPHKAGCRARWPCPAWPLTMSMLKKPRIFNHLLFGKADASIQFWCEHRWCHWDCRGFRRAAENRSGAEEVKSLESTRRKGLAYMWQLQQIMART